MYSLDIKVPRRISDAAVNQLRARLEGIPEVHRVTPCDRDRALCVEMRPAYATILRVKRLAAELVDSAHGPRPAPCYDVGAVDAPAEAVIG